MKNWMPRSLGSMMLRPGLQKIDETANDNPGVLIDFIKRIDDTAQLEFTNQLLRVRVNEVLISRVAVSTAVTNGDFTTNINNWNDEDESGAVSSWVAPGRMSLVGTTFSAAIRTQQVAVAGGDAGKEHALRIVIVRGNVTLRVGSIDGGDDYIEETTISEGTHSLAFTPNGSFWIQVSALTEWAALIESINVEAAGTLTVPTPWLAADLHKIRWDQSGDVIFISTDGYQQYKIERRSTTSWSVVKYYADDGPFLLPNIGTTTITPSDISGDISLISSRELFKPEHVGALFRLTSIGQLIEGTLGGANQFSDPIRITGVGAAQRTFSIVRSSAWVGTLTLQRSVGDVGAWVDVASSTFTTNGTSNYNDTLDNQIIYYRIGFKTGEYTSGTAAVSMSYSSGGLTGIVRITGYNGGQSVTAAVLVHLGGTTATSDWAEGQWSDYRGFPTAVAFFEGRLWWVGRDKINGSVSDAFASFDDTVVGDSGPISRSIGSGPVDVINWVIPLQRLILGGQAAEHSVRSSSLEEPLTPTDFNIKTPSTRGSAAVPGLKVDTNGIFVQRGDPDSGNTYGTRLIELAYQGVYAVVDYTTDDLSKFCPEVSEIGITRMDVQRKPDTRIHCVRADGTAAVLVYDPLEDLKAWVEVETDGLIEDVLVMPGGREDKVYYIVNRTINGVTKRFIEKWSMENECIGGTLNKQADCFITFTNAPASSTVNVPHLKGETVVVWADGKCLADAQGNIATFLVDAITGNISLTHRGAAYQATTGVVGLGYTAQFRSAKLAYAAQAGTAITQTKAIDHLGVVLANTHALGLQYGRTLDADDLDDMPGIEDGAPVDPDYIWTEYDKPAFEFDGDWDTDSRLCLQAMAPRPACVLAAVVGVKTNERT